MVDGNEKYIGVDHNIPKRSLMIPHENYLDLDFEVFSNKSNDIDKIFDLCLCLK